MKDNEAKFTILDLSSFTYDGSENSIVDADIKLQSEDGIEVWAFTPNWTLYFPYHEPHHPYGIGQTLINNLIGRKITAVLPLLNFEDQKSIEKTKSIVQKERLTTHYTITGIVIGKEPCNADWHDPNVYEWVYIDCGIIITTRVTKDQYSIGDWLTTYGRLDAQFIDY